MAGASLGKLRMVTFRGSSTAMTLETRYDCLGKKDERYDCIGKEDERYKEH